jgi:hypothetical protein
LGKSEDFESFGNGFLDPPFVTQLGWPISIPWRPNLSLALSGGIDRRFEVGLFPYGVRRFVKSSTWRSFSDRRSRFCAGHINSQLADQLAAVVGGRHHKADRGQATEAQNPASRTGQAEAPDSTTMQCENA